MDATLSSALDASNSQDPEDRVNAAQVLAQFADEPEAQAALLRLAADPHDTFVSAVTARSLLARRDRQGIRLWAIAYARLSPDGDDEDLADELGSAAQSDDTPAELVPLLRSLAEDPDAETREAALEVLREFRWEEGQSPARLTDPR